MSENDREYMMELERASLLPNRYYIILRPDEEDTFAMTAYSTGSPGLSKDEDEMDVAGIVQLGIIDAIERNTGELFERGLGLLNDQSLAKAVFADDDSEEAVVAKEGNVVKVDFGRKQ